MTLDPRGAYSRYDQSYYNLKRNSSQLDSENNIDDEKLRVSYFSSIHDYQ